MGGWGDGVHYAVDVAGSAEHAEGFDECALHTCVRVFG
jgi:hypothetical protein